MESTVETVSPTRAKLTVEVPFEELKPSLDAAYQSIAEQINVPGFRQGKVPPPIIDRQVGREAVLNEAINDLLPKKYAEAMQENELEPLAQPEVDITQVPTDEESLVFTAETDVKPQIELPSYTGLEAEVEDIEVTDEEVASEIDDLRGRFGTRTEVDRPAADGDFVSIDLTARKDGEVLEGAEVSEMSYQVGAGGMLDGLDEALTGMSAGETTTFDSQLVGGELVGQEVQVEVTLHAVQEQQLPEFDDEFAQMASEFDTAEEMRADVRERLVRNKRLEQAGEARDAVLQALLDQVAIPLPDSMVQEELESRRQSVQQQLAQAGMTLEQYLEGEGQTQEDFDADMERRVRDAVAAQFLLDEIAKHEEFGVDQQDLSEHLVRRAQQQGQDPQEFANHMFEHNHVPEMVQEILRGKALAQLVENARVTDGSGNPVELKNLQPDGTIADPEEQQDDSGEEAAASAEDAPAEESPEEESPQQG